MVTKRLRPIIALTTDFGLADNYVGLMHAAILGIDRALTVVDLCHAVPPQDVAAAAFLVASAWRYFPPDTIHVVVVDPGVGSRRQAIALAMPGGTFVGPDNGVLSAVVRQLLPDLPRGAGTVPTSALGPKLRAVRLSNPRYWLSRVSATFHGRDIFAPVAAHLASGIPLERLGEPAPTIHLLPASHPIEQPDGTLVAHVVYVDHYGNLVTDLSVEQATALPQPLTFYVRGAVARGLHRFYAEGQGLVAVAGSSGRVELAWRDGSAAAALGARVGDDVEIKPVKGGGR